jgi:hypothetical protein
VTSGQPLDFSFLHIQTIESLKKEEPRAGKRKPIEDSEDEEEAKKNDAAGPNGGSPGSDTAVNAGPLVGDSSSTVNGGVPAQKETVIRASNVPQISSLLSNFNISL